ncbi:gliding motility-associated C-terminal domain-containing protein [Foetidibacter luteolus]|uniref:gliding motility-associated C-terminal domain-containing protein n=1 Tax=Foetidibacter luteolus TaxID=2608880 RepID=UPI00129ABF4D|nr:gliding motility-associated C-terminal domain-containing protein [Foetidibacter luteolus]
MILFSTVAMQAHAQLCNGSLGDAVVNIDFGAGVATQAPFSLANYSFISYSCPNDGSYTVGSSSPPCFSDSWHTLSEDHTPGDVNGLMMIVNASFTRGDFFIDTVSGLCGNTTYEFAAWILNILKTSSCSSNGIQPNLTFSIEKTDGTVIQTYQSGNIPAQSSPLWKQYGFFFKTGENVSSVVIRLTNNADGGCGNDLVLDDITFRPCGPDIAASINGVEGDLLDICEGSAASYTLKGAVSDGFTSPALQWQQSSDTGATWKDIPGATASTYAVSLSITGSYMYRLAVGEKTNIGSPNCRVSSNVVTIRVNPLPATTASSNKPIICTSEVLRLTATGGATYAWAGPNNFTSTVQSPDIAQPAQAAAGRYYVTVTSDKKCSSRDSVDVAIYPTPAVNAGTDVAICKGSSTQLHGSGDGTLQWSPATFLSSATDANPTANPADSIAYVLTVTGDHQCMAFDTVKIFVMTKPVAMAGPDKIIIEGQATTLEGQVTGDSVSISWSPQYYINNAQLLQPQASPLQSTTYTLQATSKAGCGTTTDDVFVKVYTKVLVPNAFSPNGDGINDTWVLEAISAYPNCKVTVFNRYGSPVFSSTGYNTKWDGSYNGKPLPLGTYYYVIFLDPYLPKLTGWIALLK